MAFPDPPPESESPKETVAAPPSGEAAVAQRAAEDGVGAVWSPGEVILGLYEVKGLLGEGGMGTVYQVHHKGWNTDLAVKSPKPEELAKAGGAENFVREAETWVGLGLHPHIVSCFYVRTLGGIPRVFAEYVAGGSLATWIRERKLYEGGREKALERILDIAIQFAWGLGYAHEQGLIHQDVKPANVMMAPDGTVKVTDFGLARARGRAPAPGEAKPGGGTLMAASGGMTPAYASPEQARGQTLTRRTDIWSWGVSVLEMFTGEVTWLAGQAAAEALQGYLEVGAEDPELPKMPPPIAELLARCFVEDPQTRPQGMGEVAKHLQGSYEQLTKSAYARPEPKAPELTADSLNNRALSLIDLGKEQEAEAAWLSALQADAQHPDTTYNRGLMRWRRGEISDDQLAQQLEEVRKTHGDTWQTKYLLALVHMERADVDAARPLLEEAAREAPNDPSIKESLELLNSDKITPGRFLRAFEGHTDMVKSVCFSADGRYALSGGEDKTLRLWEVASGRCIRAFEGHSEPVSAVCLSPDGRYALSGSGDMVYRYDKGRKSGTLRLWDVASGRCVRVLEGHNHWVKAVCFSSDGQYALSGGGDKTLRLWEVEGGRCLQTFEGHSGAVTSVCISADGCYALSGGGLLDVQPRRYDTSLRLWEVASGRCLRNFEGHTQGVSSVSLSLDGSFALSASNADGTLRLWEVASGRCLRTLEVPQVNAPVCFSPDGRYALYGTYGFGTYEGTVKLWEVASGRCLCTVKSPRSVPGYALTSACFSSTGRYALLSSPAIYRTQDHPGKGGRVWLWQCPSGVRSPTRLSRRWTFSEVSDANAQEEELLQRAEATRAAGRWSNALQILREARELPGKSRSPRLLDAWGRLALLCRRPGIRASWLGRTFVGHTSAVNAVCFGRDGSFALSGSKDGKLRYWEVISGRCLQTLEGHENGVISVGLSPDGRHALSGDWGGSMRLWEISSGRCLRALKGRESCLASSIHFSPDARFALHLGLWHGGPKLIPDEGSAVSLWDLTSGSHQSLIVEQDGNPRDSGCCLGISPDWRRVLVGTSSLRVYELGSGECRQEWEGQTYVWSVSLSPDGRYALSGHWNRTLRLWEVASGRCLRTLEGHSGPVSCVCFSPDGRYALSGSGMEDTTLRVWDAASGRCLRTLLGHTRKVHSVCFSPDGRYALSGSEDATMRLWHLDWELEACDPTDWDDGARPYLETFLTLHTPYLGSLPADRGGVPSWTESDFKNLLDTLGYAGYGWLRPEGVRKQLESMARDWKGSSSLMSDSKSTTEISAGHELS